MDICNAFLALGGDRRNTVPKFDITAAEIAVLQAIHGDEAVTEIEVVGDVNRSNRDELSRLRQTYGRARPEGSEVSHVDVLFPGAAARVFDTVEELELSEIFFKAETRKVPGASAGGKASSKKEKPAKKTDKKDEDEKGDGVEDIGDEHADEKQQIFG